MNKRTLNFFFPIYFVKFSSGKLQLKLYNKTQQVYIQNILQINTDQLSKRKCNQQKCNYPSISTLSFSKHLSFEAHKKSCLKCFFVITNF